MVGPPAALAGDHDLRFHRQSALRPNDGAVVELEARQTVPNSAAAIDELVEQSAEAAQSETAGAGILVRGASTTQVRGG